MIGRRALLPRLLPVVTGVATLWLLPPEARPGNGPDALQLAVLVAMVTWFAIRYWQRRPTSAQLLAANGPARPDGASLIAPRTQPDARAARRQALLSAGGMMAAMGGAAALAVLTRSLVAQTNVVLSVSMLPTLEPADRLLTNRAVLGLRNPLAQLPPAAHVPRRGDVIVFRPDGAGADTPDLVKRVIGVPGDHITMWHGHPVINGLRLPSCDLGPYVYVAPEGAVEGRAMLEYLEDRTYLTLLSSSVRPFNVDYVVRPGELFVLGDNRSNSVDSRAGNGGRGAGVPLTAVQGRVDLILAGRGRDSRLDARRLLKTLAPRIHLPGIDDQQLTRKLEECGRHHPEQTLPPAPPRS